MLAIFYIHYLFTVCFNSQRETMKKYTVASFRSKRSYIVKVN